MNKICVTDNNHPFVVNTYMFLQTLIQGYPEGRFIHSNDLVSWLIPFPASQAIQPAFSGNESAGNQPAGAVTGDHHFRHCAR